MDCDVWNVYGEIEVVAFDATVTELEIVWCSTTQTVHKLNTKAPSLVSFATTHLCESGFSSLHLFEKQVSEPFEHSNDLGVALTNCVPSNERKISEKHQQKYH